jgi:hypothetical protein
MPAAAARARPRSGRPTPTRAPLDSRAGAFLLLALLIGACGVTSESSPRRLPVGDVPFDLLAGAPAPVTTVPAQALEAAHVFLVRRDGIVPVPRAVRGPVTPGELLDALLRGPTDGEAAAGLRTAVSADSSIVASEPELEAGTVLVDLTRQFAQVGGQEQILALGQLVLTLTALPTIERVRFALDGVPVDVPRADGTLVTGPVTRADYAALAAPP